MTDLESTPNLAKKLKKVRKAIGFLEANPRHPGLQTHKYETHHGPNGEPLFEAYVENDTPGAWRIWFWWGPGADTISILNIGPHPD